MHCNLQNQNHNSQLSNSPEEDMAIDIQMAQAFESHTTKSSTESHRDCPLARLQRRFRVHFITLIELLYNKAGSETSIADFFASFGLSCSIG